MVSARLSPDLSDTIPDDGCEQRGGLQIKCQYEAPTRPYGQVFCSNLILCCGRVTRRHHRRDKWPLARSCRIRIARDRHGILLMLRNNLPLKCSPSTPAYACAFTTTLPVCFQARIQRRARRGRLKPLIKCNTNTSNNAPINTHPISIVEAPTVSVRRVGQL